VRVLTCSKVCQRALGVLTSARRANTLMIELDTYAKKAAEVLGEESLGKLRMYPFGDGSYRCPLLWHTAKDLDTAAGVIFLQDWYPDAGDTRDFEKQIEYVAKVVGSTAGPQIDPSLDPLFRSKTWQKRFNDGWVATNAIWGLRPSGPKVRFLGKKRHFAARQVWTLLIQDLLKDNPQLRVTLCGAWAGNHTKAADYLKSLGVVPANIEQKKHPLVWTNAERQ
jgi:hypothetical protein